MEDEGIQAASRSRLGGPGRGLPRSCKPLGGVCETPPLVRRTRMRERAMETDHLYHFIPGHLRIVVISRSRSIGVGQVAFETSSKGNLSILRGWGNGHWRIPGGISD